jgi:hypothetical protein
LVRSRRRQKRHSHSSDRMRSRQSPAIYRDRPADSCGDQASF